MIGIWILSLLLIRMSIVLDVAVSGAMLCGVYLLQLFKYNKRNKTEMMGRAIIDEDPVKVFHKIKRLRSREKWDLNVKEITRSDEQTDRIKKDYQMAYLLPNMPWPYNKLNKKIKCKVQRWNFILNQDSCIIIDSAKIFDLFFAQSEPKFTINEVFVLQRCGSSKCQVSFTTIVSTNLMPIFQLSKFRDKRLLNISTIRDFIIEERLLDQINEGNADEEDSDVEAKEVKNQDKEKDDRILSHKKTFVLGENELEIQSTKEPSQSKSLQMTKSGFDPSKRADPKKSWQVVDSLMNNTYTGPTKTFDDRRPGYKVMKDGGVECLNKDELKAQEGIVIDLMKSAGKVLMEGQNVVGVSLPVRIFEPRSTMERICDGWAFGPIYLNRAAEIKDPVERLKNVVTFCMAGLYMSCKQMKPFNPILGETYQGYWPDGSEIYCEHTSHHPPITSFMCLDAKRKWKYSGYYEYTGRLTGNSVIARQKGPNILQFDDGTKITYNLPPFRISGLLLGARTFEWIENVVFKDEKNKIECSLAFYEAKGLFTRAIHPTDFFEGTIYKTTDPSKALSKVKGRWTEYIEFDGKKYWDIKVVDPLLHHHTLEPLPSDCRFREDLIYLAQRDMIKAQEHKIRLEVIQRADRKLRNDYNQKKGIKSGH